MGLVVGVAAAELGIKGRAERPWIGRRLLELDNVEMMPQRSREDGPDMPLANRSPALRGGHGNRRLDFFVDQMLAKC